MIVLSDAFEFVKTLDTDSIDMFYIDPPFGTGSVQKRGENCYDDPERDIAKWLSPIFEHGKRSLKDTGHFCLHVDSRHSHKCKITLDNIFGEENFINEIIWSYNYGGRSRDRWAAKHDNIFVYSKNVLTRSWFADQSDRIPYKTPELQYLNRSREAAEKRIAQGQIPTDVWSDISIIGTQAKERVGYPTQKPVKLIERFLRSLTQEGDVVVDVFAGSGTTGQACKNLNRKFILIDSNPKSIGIIEARLK